MMLFANSVSAVAAPAADWDHIVRAPAEEGYTEPEMSVNEQRATAVSSEQYKDVVPVYYWGEMIGVCALRQDGTVATTKIEGYEEEIGRWTDIEKLLPLASGCVAGIKTDGTVLIAADEETIRHYPEYCCGYEEYRGWTDIVDLTDISNKIFGIKRDGTVVATGGGSLGYEMDARFQFRFSDWKDIRKLKAVSNMNGDYVLLGLSEDGTLRSSSFSVFVPEEWDGMQGVRDLNCAKYIYLILRMDGTVDIGGLDAGLIAEEVQAWNDIIQVCAGSSFAVGLKRDGTVISAGYSNDSALSDWEGIRKIYCDDSGYIFGICGNGTVKCCEPDHKRSYMDYSVDREKLESWNGIERITWGYDQEANEIIVIGFLSDGRIVSTKDLAFQ